MYDVSFFFFSLHKFSIMSFNAFEKFLKRTIGIDKYFMFHNCLIKSSKEKTWENYENM